MRHWQKVLQRSSLNDQTRIEEVLQQLRKNNFPPDTIKLKGGARYRTRVGDWRIFFHYESNQLIVEDIQRRGDHTY